MYMHYKYKLLYDNQVFKGKISGTSYEEVLRVIRGSGKLIHLGRILINFKKNNFKRLLSWFEELSLLLKGGTSIERALEYTAENYEFNRSLLSMIKSGIKFNKAVEYHAFFFDPISINIINVLIDSATIESVFYFLLDYHTRTMQFREKFYKALFLPVITLAISCLTMLGLLFFIKNPIVNTLNQLKLEPPFLLLLIDRMSLNDIIQLSLVLLLGILYVKRFIPNIPIISSYYYHRDLFIVFYSLSRMLENGVTILECFGIIQKVSMVKRIKEMFYNMSKEILKGESIYTSMSKYNVPSVYLNLIKMNESVGNLSDGFLKCSKVAEGYSTNYLNNLSNTIHPMIILINTMMIICFLNMVIFPIYNSCSGFIF